MARHEGGIFSRPRGKTGGIVFGAARTREGKMVTSRLLVSPSNPDTPAQQLQRAKFSDSLNITRSLGAVIYQDDWNRAIAQLPGFQSMMSVFMRDLDADRVFTAPPDVNLGILGFPTDLVIDGEPAANTCSFSWTDTAPIPKNVGDTSVFIAIENFVAVPPDKRRGFSLTTGLRSDGTAMLENLESAKDYLCAVYFRGAVGEDTEGLLSIVRFALSTSGV
ncbi:hypothetical protein ES705_37115 [subsurface metagenome]